jgi:predicted DNA-binding protein (MmcQ/YjbR family)
MSKLHWNSVYVKGDVTNKMLVELIEDSYELVFSSLTKKVRNEIHDL